MSLVKDEPYQFRAGQWLDDERCAQVQEVCGNFVTVISRVSFSASWLDWFEKKGWDFCSSTRTPGSLPGYKWENTHITNFRKIR